MHSPVPGPDPVPAFDRGAAGALFLDPTGRVLLVEPSYKDTWEIPGGCIEPGESPLEACRRELVEELGVAIEPGPLLCVDHRPAVGNRPEALRFVFDGGMLTDDDTARFVLDPSELRSWRFVALDDLDGMVVPVLARRIRFAWGSTRAVYLEDGRPPIPTLAPAPAHPSPEIPPGLVAKVVARRGHLHVHADLHAPTTALVVVDLDVGSCARDPRSAAVVAEVARLARALRSAGGTVAFVTSAIPDVADLARRLGSESADRYASDAKPGGAGTILAEGLDVDPADVRSTKRGASAFFPGNSDLHEQLVSRGIGSILVAGLVTNICCESTARDATELGYRVTLVSDACVGHGFGLHEASLSTFFRTFGDVRPVADVLGLLDGAGTVRGVGGNRPETSTSQ